MQRHATFIALCWLFWVMVEAEMIVSQYQKSQGHSGVIYVQRNIVNNNKKLKTDLLTLWKI